MAEDSFDEEPLEEHELKLANTRPPNFYGIPWFMIIPTPIVLFVMQHYLGWKVTAVFGPILIVVVIIICRDDLNAPRILGTYFNTIVKYMIDSRYYGGTAANPMTMKLTNRPRGIARRGR